MKKHLVMILAVWVMFYNGQIVKYPQAGAFISQLTYKGSRPDPYFRLTNCMTGDIIVVIPQGKVKKIGFSMSEAWTRGYIVYKNAKFADDYSDDYNIRTINGVRRVARDPK